MTLELEEVLAMFKKLGLQPPGHIFVPFGIWSESGVPVTYDYVAEPRRKCSCCDCYLTIGPPGCDGTNCQNCGGPH